MMIGVKARARRPTSTASRVTSIAFATVRKLRAGRGEERALESQDEQQDPLAVREEPLRAAAARSGRRAQRARARPWLSSRPSTRSEARAPRMIAPWMAFSQNGLTPAKVRAGPIVPRSADADEGAHEGASASANGRPSHHDRGHRLQLEPEARVAGHRREANGVQERGQPGQGAHEHEDEEDGAGRLDPRETSGFAIGAHGVDAPGRRRDAVAPRPGRSGRRSATATMSRCPPFLAEAEPLEVGGEVLHPRSLGHPPQAVAPRHQGGQGDDDRGEAEASHEQTVHGAELRAEREHARRAGAALGAPPWPAGRRTR